MLIIHCADIHLDHAFSAAEARAGIAGLRREELRGALVRVLQIAAAHRATAVTIAGDLFEADRVTADTIKFLCESFAKAAPIEILIAPGNRDPYDAESPYRHTKWPRNVHVFRDPVPKPYPLGDDVVIWGVAHTASASRTNPIEGFRAPEEKTNLFLLHSSLKDYPLDESARLAPLRIEDIEAANAHFALLGHSHRPQVAPGGTPRAAYPGSPEPLSARDGESHGCLPVSIVDGTTSVGFHPTATRRYVEIEVDLGGIGRPRELVDRVVSEIEAEDRSRLIVRVRLAGRLATDFVLDPHELERSLCRTFGAAEVVCESLEAGLDALGHLEGPKGRIVRRLLDEADGAQGEPRRRALAIGLMLRTLKNGSGPKL